MPDFNKNQLAEFLHGARWPVQSDPEPNFFSIAGISSREVPLSNTYAFFFRSAAPHGLGNLFATALRNILTLKKPGWPELDAAVHAACEYPMRHGQRLDLLIHDGPSERSPQSASFQILVENKINHWLANDFDNYWSSIEAKGYKAGVVLGRKAEIVPPEWTYITHLELARAVEYGLGPKIQQANPRYLPVLLHFLEHLKQMSQDPIEFAQAFAFAQRHRRELAQAKRLLTYMDTKAVQMIGQNIIAAFGDDYVGGAILPDYPRVHIRPRSTAGIDYLVWFGHMVDPAESPSFSVTLFPTTPAVRQQKKQLQQLLILHPLAQQAGIGQPGWFSHVGWFNEMLVGKDYPFNGTTLDDLAAQVREVLNTDWAPLEPVWLGGS
ncbi:hypothetical protein EJV47_22460 [Hymenobacter gummosus]|uniref:Uncharacterized protein n=1 Tax=Hymenobacter gummosus TaxID=1776032 RepID=A0A431TXP1_9BACT|nr:PD-(D/E)XK nuclease family protein [Hymenobacter gummosus]RTQ46291.1 hypothetical protein EJV47_22460 [Hymenobacter gummosus]